VELELGGAPERREFVVVPASNGPWTVLVSSVHGDPFVELLDEEGAPIAVDDNGGVEWNARLVVEGTTGEELRIAAGFAEGQGELRVELREGGEDLAGVELAHAQAAFFAGRGRVLLELGNAQEAGSPERHSMLTESAVLLHQAGQLAFALNELRSCQRSYAEVYELARELNHSVLGTLALAHLGAVHAQFGEHSAAEARLKNAMGYLETNLQGYASGPVLEMFVLKHLGDVQLEGGDLEAARTSLERALELARDLGHHANEVILGSRLARLALRTGDLDAAREQAVMAVKTAREAGDPNVLATVLLDAAELSVANSEFAEARSLLDEGVRSTQSDHTLHALVGSRANLDLRTGDELSALERFAEVLDYSRETGARGLEISALGGISEAALQFGDYRVARLRLEEVRALLGSGGSPREQVKVLTKLARVAIHEGDLETSGSVIDEALALVRTTNDRRLEMDVNVSMVRLLYYRGEYADALEPALVVLDFGRDLGLAEVEAIGLRCVAELRLRLGDREAARRDVDLAVEILRALGDRLEIQDALRTSWEIAWLDGDVERMASILDEAETCLRDAPRLDPEKGALLRAQDSFSSWGRNSQDFVAVQLARGVSENERRSILRAGLRRAGLWKARSLWQGIAEHRESVRNDRVTALRREHDDIVAAQEAAVLQISDAVREEGEGQLAQTARGRWESLERERHSVFSQLRKVSPADAVLDQPDGILVEDLGAVRGEGRILIEYVEGQERVYAYRVQGDEVDFVTLGEREIIASHVQDYLQGMTRIDRLSTPATIARRGRELFGELLAPLLDRALRPTQLLVVPSECLASLPFEALVTDAPDDPHDFNQVSFLLDEAEVLYAASTPVLALLEEIGPRQGPGRALVLADALYGQRGGGQARAPAGIGAWVDLPGTRWEALSLAAQLGAAAGGADVDSVYLELAEIAQDERSLSLERDAFELHLGAEATPERLLSGGLREYAIVHCASHGWLDTDDWYRSGLVLSPDKGGNTLVSLLEILDLELDADLAVLSACDTGRGTVQRGEGVRSLARAFQYSGARSVVASLWPVDDAAAQAAMQVFYERCVEPGTTIASALRDARLAVRHGKTNDAEPLVAVRGRSVVRERVARQIGHPYYWASFVVSGLPGATLTVTAR
jgi:CHAT domain-containing protein/tetratricopeptide (TPR) repeat protein